MTKKKTETANKEILEKSKEEPLLCFMPYGSIECGYVECIDANSSNEVSAISISSDADYTKLKDFFSSMPQRFTISKAYTAKDVATMIGKGRCIPKQITVDEFIDTVNRVIKDAQIKNAANKKKKLKDIIDKHVKWLNTRKDGELDDLRDADFSNIDFDYIIYDSGYVSLQWANLKGADFSGSVLRRIDLSHADLTGANFSNADIHCADMAHANLSDVNFTNTVFSSPDDKSIDYHLDLSYSILTNAIFTNANLEFVNFEAAYLSGAKISGAKCYYANFTKADLTGADFTNADLSYAEFLDAKLTNVKFAGANLSHITFSDVNLSALDLNNTKIGDTCFDNTNLSKANLSNSKLYNISFYNANLNHTNFSGAVLVNAIFTEANLNDVKFDNASFDDVSFADAMNVPNVPQFDICPAGEIIGWKKLKDGLIAKILIPADAKRSNATTRTCRCEYAKVLAIYNDKEEEVNEGTSIINWLIYNTGKFVRADSFDSNRWNECSHGIHFFLTKKEADSWKEDSTTFFDRIKREDSLRPYRCDEYREHELPWEKNKKSQ